MVAGSDVSCVACSVSGFSTFPAQLSSCPRHGNIVVRTEAEQVQGLALERSGFGADRDGGLLLGGQAGWVQGETGKVSHERREAVHRKALRCGSGGGLESGAGEILATSTGVLRCARAAVGSWSWNSSGASRRRICHST